MLGLLFAGAGIAAIVIGLWDGSRTVRDFVYQVQGKCDYLSCTGPWTLPALVGNLVLTAAGTAVLARCVYGAKRSSVDRGHG